MMMMMMMGCEQIHYNYLQAAEFSLESESRWTIQEIPNILLNPKNCHCVRNSLLLVPIVSEMNPVHILSCCFFQIYF
jgi:hypothetical protein